MASLGLHEYGVQLNLESPDLSQVQLQSVLMTGWRSRDPLDDAPVCQLFQGAERWEFRDGDRLLAQHRELPRFLAAVGSQLQRYFAEFSSDPIFVHAGVVVWKDRAMLFPGASYSGKSTLVHELVGAGASYFSDEYALLDAQTGRVRAFPRELALRGPERLVNLPSNSPPEGVPLGSVWELRYTPGATLQVAETTLGQGILSLIGNTVRARDLGPILLPAFERGIREARCFKGIRGEVQDCLQQILEGSSQ